MSSNNLVTAYRYFFPTEIVNNVHTLYYVIEMLRKNITKSVYGGRRQKLNRGSDRSVKINKH